LLNFSGVKSVVKHFWGKSVAKLSNYYIDLVLKDHQTRRKGSTNSLSHIESSLMRGGGGSGGGGSVARSGGATPNASSQSLARIDPVSGAARWDSGATGGATQVEQMSLASSDAGDNPSPHNSKFFMFGARAGRKASMSSKQKQTVNMRLSLYMQT